MKGHLVIIKIINLEIDADILALICFCKNIQHNVSELISLTGNETQKGQVTVCVRASVSKHVRGKGRAAASGGEENGRAWLVSHPLMRTLLIQWLSGAQHAAQPRCLAACALQALAQQGFCSAAFVWTLGLQAQHLVSPVPLSLI